MRWRCRPPTASPSPSPAPRGSSPWPTPGGGGWRPGSSRRRSPRSRAQGASQVTARIGPHIHAGCYEFGADDLDRLVRRFGPEVAARTHDGRSAFDATAATAAALASAGVAVRSDPVGGPGAGRGRPAARRASRSAGSRTGPGPSPVAWPRWCGGRRTPRPGRERPRGRVAGRRRDPGRTGARPHHRRRRRSRCGPPGGGDQGLRSRGGPHRPRRRTGGSRGELRPGAGGQGRRPGRRGRRRGTGGRRGPGRAARWHFLGRLQTNKVRHLAPFVALWQSVDRADLVREIAKRAPGASILVQLNLSEEPQKGGCRPADLPALVGLARDSGLDVQGLMGVGPAGEPEAARPASSSWWRWPTPSSSPSGRSA